VPKSQYIRHPNGNTVEMYLRIEQLLISIQKLEIQLVSCPC
jgi:hypothetical protein